VTGAERAMSTAQVAVARRFGLPAVALALLPDWLVRGMFWLISREA
jgi:hypothetical protein